MCGISFASCIKTTGMQANLLNEKLDALKREQEVYHFGLAVFIQWDNQLIKEWL